MHRWLVAVFALHFFLSASAFAFGMAPHTTPPSAHSAVATASVDSSASAAPESAGLADLFAEHGLGLSDTQPDLPECLDVPILTSSQGAPLRTPSPPLARELTPPVLDGPQRPPRGAALVA
ncbi:hypothetical protein [Hydrogenophaga sp. BPS33]|uniref:hypothetical protein n=1 Tax=Hydrogenophaga sp. BPS33 TaxID=2651974 RepID=UPI00132003F5|nr:hypothetical protein [Hydrogenophaga sp. BPS33]QHE88423.1 hypothetical protein F9K07_27850 [Hydrogenophaga sp. BPS33]